MYLIDIFLPHPIFVGHCLIYIWLNSLWPSDAIWQHRSASTLAHIMACCLTAPSQYRKQFWLIINGVCSIYLEVISQEVLKISIHRTSLNITLLNHCHISQGPLKKIAIQFAVFCVTLLSKIIAPEDVCCGRTTHYVLVQYSPIVRWSVFSKIFTIGIS